MEEKEKPVVCSGIYFSKEDEKKIDLINIEKKIPENQSEWSDNGMFNKCDK